MLGKNEDISECVENHDGPVVVYTLPNDGEVIYKISTLSDEVIIPLSATALDLNRLTSTV